MTGRKPWAEIEHKIYEGQIRLLPDPCAICGRYTGLMIEQGGVFACVECHTKENGEDGDEASP